MKRLRKIQKKELNKLKKKYNKNKIYLKLEMGLLMK